LVVIFLVLLRPSYFGSLAGADRFLPFRLAMIWSSFPSVNL
jgi:hypothetical protein